MGLDSAASLSRESSSNSSASLAGLGAVFFCFPFGPVSLFFFKFKLPALVLVMSCEFAVVRAFTVARRVPPPADLAVTDSEPANEPESVV